MRAVNIFVTQSLLREWVAQGYNSGDGYISGIPRLEAYGSRLRLVLDFFKLGAFQTTVYGYNSTVDRNADVSRPVNVGSIVYGETNGSLAFWLGSVWENDPFSVATGLCAALSSLASSLVIQDGVPIPGPPGTTNFNDLTDTPTTLEGYRVDLSDEPYGTETVGDVLDAASGSLQRAASKTAMKLLPVRRGSALLDAGGVFDWDSTVPISIHQQYHTEGVMAAPSPSEIGAWVRRRPEVLTPGFFGVGSSEPNGDHNDAFIDIDAALNEGFGNGQLVLDRPCRLPNGWVVSAKNAKISQVGSGSLTIDNGANYAAIHGYFADGLKVQGVTIKNEPGGTRANTIYGIFAEGCSDVVIRGCDISGTLAAAWFNLCKRVTVEQCYGHDLLADGFHFSSGSEDCYAKFNTVLNCGDDAFSCSTYGDSSAGAIRAKNIYYIGNLAIGGFWGAHYAMYETDGGFIIGNRSIMAPGSGIAVGPFQDASAPCRDIDIVSNFIQSPGQAQYVLGKPSEGVSRFEHGCGIYAEDIMHLNISDNRIRDVGASPNANKACIGLKNVDYVDLTKNKMRQSNAFGVYCLAEVKNFDVSDNLFQDLTRKAFESDPNVSSHGGECSIRGNVTKHIHTSGGTDRMRVSQNWYPDSTLIIDGNKDSRGLVIDAAPQINYTIISSNN